YAPPALSCSACILHPLFFCSNCPPTIEIYTLSLHDALPISIVIVMKNSPFRLYNTFSNWSLPAISDWWEQLKIGVPMGFAIFFRSEEHTSELQSRFDLVCRLLLEKKNTKTE